MQTTLFTLSFLLSIAAAHFQLASPKVRGFNENNLPEFPCGGQNTVSATRSQFPITAGSVTVIFGHSTTNVEVLIAFGNTPGSAFNTIIKRPFHATGLGNYCISDLTFPAGMNITAGMNATIQVQSNGDPEGGLYNCADITFVDSLSTPQSCPKSDISIGAATVSGHPNGTAFTGSQTQQPSASGTVATSASRTATGTATTTSQAGAGSVVIASLGGLVLAGAAAMAFVL